MFQYAGEYGKAKEYHDKTLAVSIGIGDTVGDITCYENIGVVFFYLGEYIKAKDISKKHLRST